MLHFVGSLGSKALVGAIVVMAGVLQSLGDCNSVKTTTVKEHTATIICASGCQPTPNNPKHVAEAITSGQPATFQVKDEGFGSGKRCPVQVTFSQGTFNQIPNQTVKPGHGATVAKSGSTCTITTAPVSFTFSTKAQYVELDVEVDGSNFVTDRIEGSRVFGAMPAGSGASSSSSSSSSSNTGGGGGGGGGTTSGGPTVTFGATQKFPTSAHATAVAAADLAIGGSASGDKRASLIVSDDDQNSANHDDVEVWPSTGTSALLDTAGTPYDLGVGMDPRFITTADFNDDGYRDFAVALFHGGNTPGYVSIFLNNKNGTFTPISASGGTSPLLPVGDGPWGIASGTIAGTGGPDVATADLTDNPGDVSVLDNGNGTTPASPAAFNGTPSIFPSGGGQPRDLRVGDLNGDGKNDLVVANNGSSSQAPNVTILRNTTTTPDSPTFAAAQPVFTPSTGAGEPTAIAVGDFNGDGKPDVAIAMTGGSAGSSVVVLLNQTPANATSFTFAAPVTYALTSAGNQPVAITTGDFNADGKVDLATANAGTSNASVLLGKGDGTFAAPTPVGADTQPTDVAAGDVNGDGKDDLIVSNYDTGTSTTSGSVTVNLSQGGTAAGAHAARAHRKAKQLRVRATGAASVAFKSFGKMFIDSSGNGHIRGAAVTGRLTARLLGLPHKRFPAVPHAVTDILNSTFYGKLDGDRYVRGRLNPILVKGLIVARSRKAPRVKACIRVTPHNGSVQYNAVTLLAGTGPLAKVTMTALYPPFSIDTSLAATTGAKGAPYQTLLFGTRKKAARMPRSCTALLKQLR